MSTTKEFSVVFYRIQSGNDFCQGSTSYRDISMDEALAKDIKCFDVFCDDTYQYLVGEMNIQS